MRQHLSRSLTVEESLEKLSEKLQFVATEAKSAILSKIAYLKERKEEFERKQITNLHRSLIYYISDYGLIETAPLIKLSGQQWTRAESRITALWQKGFAKRLKIEDQNDLIYYGTRKGISLISDIEGIDAETLRREADNKREADYARALSRGEFSKLHGFYHRLKISRFHARIELGCRSLPGINFTDYQQETESFNLTRPKLSIKHNSAEDSFKIKVFEYEKESALLIPDITFQFRFEDPSLKSIDIYVEIDNGSQSIPEIMKKAYNYHHLFLQEYHKKPNAPIMRVAFETIDAARCERMTWALQEMPIKTKALFLFTYANIFDNKTTVKIGGKKRALSKYLIQPEIIFDRVWLCPKDFDPQEQRVHSLLGDYYEVFKNQPAAAQEGIEEILEIDEMGGEH